MDRRTCLDAFISLPANMPLMHNCTYFIFKFFKKNLTQFKKKSGKNNIFKKFQKNIIAIYPFLKEKITPESSSSYPHKYVCLELHDIYVQGRIKHWKNILELHVCICSRSYQALKGYLRID